MRYSTFTLPSATASSTWSPVASSKALQIGHWRSSKSVIVVGADASPTTTA